MPSEPVARRLLQRDSWTPDSPLLNLSGDRVGFVEIGLVSDGSDGLGSVPAVDVDHVRFDHNPAIRGAMERGVAQDSRGKHSEQQGKPNSSASFHT